MGAGHEILSLGTKLVNCYICFAVNKVQSRFTEHPTGVEGVALQVVCCFLWEIANFNKDCVAHGYFVGSLHNLLVSIFRFFGKRLVFFFDSYIYTYFKEV